VWHTRLGLAIYFPTYYLLTANASGFVIFLQPAMLAQLSSPCLAKATFAVWALCAVLQGLICEVCAGFELSRRISKCVLAFELSAAQCC
jgi:hypothetical protein